MANRVKGAKKAAAARKGHKNTTKKKSNAGTVKAARARWGKKTKTKKRK